jgi:phosphohistidine phosphatase SixA
MQTLALGRVLRNLLIVALCVAAASAFAQPLAGRDLINSLRQGGYVVVMRHANSPQTRPDARIAAPGNSRLERQLNENGHRTAKAMGASLKALGIPIGEVLSSPTFRTLETVRELALGNPKTFNELGDGSQGYEISSLEESTRFMRARAAEPPRPGTNTIIVTHLPNLQSAFGDSANDVEEGEALILRPDATEAGPVGRIKVEDWPRLASQR